MKKTPDTRKENIQKLLLRLELWFAPPLIIIPLSVSLVLLWDWYTRGVSTGSSQYTGEFLIGVLLLFGNISCDVLFLRSLRLQKKKETIESTEGI